MIFSSRTVTSDDLERETGWRAEARGLCRGDICVPFVPRGRLLDLAEAAAALRMPLIEHAESGLIALGPPSGGHAIASAQAPELELPDLDGRRFRLSSLRGWKVLLVAWAPW